MSHIEHSLTHLHHQKKSWVHKVPPPFKSFKEFKAHNVQTQLGLGGTMSHIEHTCPISSALPLIKKYPPPNPHTLKSFRVSKCATMKTQWGGHHKVQYWAQSVTFCFFVREANIGSSRMKWWTQASPRILALATPAYQTISTLHLPGVVMADFTSSKVNYFSHWHWVFNRLHTPFYNSVILTRGPVANRVFVYIKLSIFIVLCNGDCVCNRFKNEKSGQLLWTPIRNYKRKTKLWPSMSKLDQGTIVDH